jgi:hypothetical protein
MPPRAAKGALERRRHLGSAAPILGGGEGSKSMFMPDRSARQNFPPGAADSAIPAGLRS